MREWKWREKITFDAVFFEIEYEKRDARMWGGYGIDLE